VVKEKDNLRSLIIVESPGKIKTIKKILGGNFEVKASMGHVIDLPEKDLGVDVKNNFEPRYETIPKKDKVIEDLQKEVARCDRVYLAPDPDREGEAISWHLARALKLDVNASMRITFNAITPKVVLEALEHPKPIDMNKVNAQQGRRVLDRLVGYELSPLLWRKLQKGLSAGRVQSVAVLLVCKREEEIAKFIKEEYWLVDSVFQKPQTGETFKSRLFKFDKKAPKIKNAEEAEKILKVCKEQSYEVAKVLNKEKRKKPSGPFITSTLQQEASRVLNFPPSKTMKVAQKLYEGIEIEKGNTVGLITYMRTDSYRVVPEAIVEARNFIKEKYGEQYLPSTDRFYKSKSQAQDAHEAIRPAEVINTPEKLKKHLTADEYRLYNMIWKRFVASQTADAVFDSVTVEIGSGKAVFKSVGETLKFSGFLALYDVEAQNTEEKEVENEVDGDEEAIVSGRLPRLVENEPLDAKEITPMQKFTKEPPRYTTASLIKSLEELKIGRPSTYATIVKTILDRNYVEIKEKKFCATDIGMATSALLESYFTDLINVEFTAKMEDELDGIEDGKKDWREVLAEFYSPFHEKLTFADGNIKKMNMQTDVICDKCKNPLVLLFSSRGKFLACPKFPYCRNTRNIPQDFVVFNSGMFRADSIKVLQLKERLEEFEKQNIQAQKEVSETNAEAMGKCEKCGSDMVLKSGKFGQFIACSAYPKCKNAKPIQKDIGVPCPKPDCEGRVTVKKSKRGRIFYSCTEYPKCDFVSWDRPSGELCPDCGAHTVVKVSKKGSKINCSNKECGYKRDVPNEGETAPADGPSVE